MAYFQYDQNNSGGRFDIDDALGIGPVVWIEAENAKAANEHAFRIGIDPNDDYCECCGPRWCYTYTVYEFVELYLDYAFYWHPTVYVHKASGAIDRITAQTVASYPYLSCHGDRV